MCLSSLFKLADLLKFNSCLHPSGVVDMDGSVCFEIGSVRFNLASTDLVAVVVGGVLGRVECAGGDLCLKYSFYRTDISHLKWKPPQIRTLPTIITSTTTKMTSLLLRTTAHQGMCKIYMFAQGGFSHMAKVAQDCCIAPRRHKCHQFLQYFILY